MQKKKSIKPKKQAGILSHSLKNTSIHGKYFNYKPNDISNSLLGLRFNKAINYEDLLDELQNSTIPGIIPGKNKTDLKKLGSSILPFVDFESEFYWAKIILSRNLDQIIEFNKLASNYSTKLINGLYNDAERVLDDLENRFGWSIWLIKNKIAFIQISKGLEEQKKYVQDLKKELRNDGLTKFLVHYLSVRNETQTSINRFKGQVDPLLNKLKPKSQDGFREYLEYHLYGNGMDAPSALIQVLRISHSDSLIDYYVAFVHLVMSIVTFESDEHKSKAWGFINSFHQKINDPRISLIASLNSNQTDSSLLDSESVEIYDKIICNELDNIVGVTDVKVKKGINISINILLESFCVCFDKNKVSRKDEEEVGLKSKIVNGLSEILRRGPIDASKEFNDLNKLSLNFFDLPWSSSIKVVLHKEQIPSAEDANGIFLTVANFGVFHPLLIDCIGKNEFLKRYSAICENEYSQNISTNYHLKIISISLKENMISVESSFGDYIKCINCFREKDYENAIHYSNKLCEDKNGYFVRRGYSFCANSHIEKGNLIEACVKVAECYLKEKNFYPFLPIQKLVNKLQPGSQEWNSVNSLIELSIVLDAYFKYLSRDREVEIVRRFAYEDFLIRLGLDKPSQLRPYIDKIQLYKLIYYLRHVCVESVMDTSVAFAEGSEKVLEERLLVCRLLMDIDPDNAEIYNKEIEEIVRRRVIADRRLEVDQSRIYVDVKSIREWAESELEESFNRYKSYLEIGWESPEKEGRKMNFGTSLTMDIPDDEVYALLEYMIFEIRRVYLSSDFGLNRFISTRIRHGELERTMRIPLQKHNLITKRETKNGPYSSNWHWISKLGGGVDFARIDLSFKKFSENYDNLISTIANEYLQINSIEKSHGLFDFTLTEKDLSQHIALITPGTTLLTFVNNVIRSLDDKLIYTLVSIREYLHTEAKSLAKKLITELQDQIFETCGVTDVELQRSIGQARTDLSGQFDKIIEWFVPSSEGNSTPYYIGDAMSVAETIIKEATPNFKINLPESDDSGIMIHGQLPIFVDIFINIFENVIKRSGLEVPEADVSIRYDTGNDNFYIIELRISNELGKGIQLSQLENTLGKIRARLKGEKYSELLASENNSGLLKIHKSISDLNTRNSNEKPKMDFAVIDNRFEIYLIIPFDLFVLESNDNL